MNFDDARLALTMFQGYYLAYPVLATLGYFAFFTLLTTLCLPGAAVLMLLAGASFGLAWGSVVATLASATGATLTMWLSRHGLRGRVEARWGERLHTMNQGWQQNGVLYLLSLRLLPVIPFVAVNLISGLTRVPAITFFWVSALGMLPATALYVNAGVQLAQADSIQNLLSVQTLAALALLGVLPLVASRLRKKPV